MQHSKSTATNMQAQIQQHQLQQHNRLILQQNILQVFIMLNKEARVLNYLNKILATAKFSSAENFIVSSHANGRNNVASVIAFAIGKLAIIWKYFACMVIRFYNIRNSNYFFIF